MSHATVLLQQLGEYDIAILTNDQRKAQWIVVGTANPEGSFPSSKPAIFLPTAIPAGTYHDSTDHQLLLLGAARPFIQVSYQILPHDSHRRAHIRLFRPTWAHERVNPYGFPCPYAQ
ncbi:MAG: hypothetical protein ACU4EQ_06945 [Candidatus Nitrosoglobus sp.]